MSQVLIHSVFFLEWNFLTPPHDSHMRQAAKDHCQSDADLVARLKAFQSHFHLFPSFWLMKMVFPVRLKWLQGDYDCMEVSRRIWCFFSIRRVVCLCLFETNVSKENESWPPVAEKEIICKSDMLCNWCINSLYIYYTFIEHHKNASACSITTNSSWKTSSWQEVDRLRRGAVTMGQVGKLGADRMPIKPSKHHLMSWAFLRYRICRYAMYILASRIKPLSILERCFVRGTDRLHYSADRVGRKGRHDHAYDWWFRRLLTGNHLKIHFSHQCNQCIPNKWEELETLQRIYDANGLLAQLGSLTWGNMERQEWSPMETSPGRRDLTDIMRSLQLSWVLQSHLGGLDPKVDEDDCKLWPHVWLCKDDPQRFQLCWLFS